MLREGKDYQGGNGATEAHCNSYESHKTKAEAVTECNGVMYLLIWLLLLSLQIGREVGGTGLITES